MIPKKPPALICIDIQKGFHDPSLGKRNHPQAEMFMAELLNFFREKKWPIFHVQHLSHDENSPLRPDRPGVDFMDFARPRDHEMIFKKSVNSAFIGTHLEATLEAKDIQELVIMGFTTDHCVSTTTRMAANLGFKVRISEDAVATFDRVDYLGKRMDAQIIHEAALASLHQEFAQIYSQSGLIESLIHFA